MRTRFAPSPTGPLHLGHALSALTAWDLAKEQQGQFLLRIEDIDTSRARPEWEAQIFSDLAWLGMSWPEPVLRQSRQMARYEAALDHLWDLNLLYPCTCNRRDIREATSAPQGQIQAVGPDGLIYPGTCRSKQRPETRPRKSALRLDMRAALSQCEALSFRENGGKYGPDQIDLQREKVLEAAGDIVLARKGMGTSYHLSVVLDDAYQEITHVVRGEDLLDATQIHVVLQRVLNLTTPVYLHHRLVCDETGKRLAKRDDARAIALYKQDGLTPDAIRDLINLPHWRG